MITILSISLIVKQLFLKDKSSKFLFLFYAVASILYSIAIYSVYLFPLEKINIKQLLNNNEINENLIILIPVLLLICTLFINLKLIKTLFQFNKQLDNSKLLSILIPKILFSILYFIFPIGIIIFYNCI